MGMKPRLPESDPGIPLTVTSHVKNEEVGKVVEGTVISCQHSETNKKLTDNLITGPKAGD